MKSQYQQQGKAGLAPSQEGKFSLGVSWLRKGRWGTSQGLVSGLKSALDSSIPLPQVRGSVAVVQFCFSVGLMTLCAGKEFLRVAVCIAL